MPSTAGVILIAGIWVAKTKSQEVAGLAEGTCGPASTGGGGASEASRDVVAEDLTSSRAVVEASSSGLWDRVDGSVGEITSGNHF